METISGHFQQLMEASDGIMDGPTLFTELALRLSHCYQLLLRVLNAVISWNEFQKAEHRPLLADAFKVNTSSCFGLFTSFRRFRSFARLIDFC